MVEISNATGVPSVNPEVSAPDQQLEVDPKAAAAGQQLGAAATNVGKFFGQLQTTDVLNKANSQAQGVMNDYMRLQGQDALNAAPDVQKQISDIYGQARGNLVSLDQMQAFDQTAGDYQTRYFGRMIAEKGQEAQVQYATKTINDSMDIADQHAAQAATAPNPATQDQLFQDSMANARQAAVRGVQLQGDEGDASVVQDAVAQADSRVTSSYIQAQAVRDPNAGMAAFNQYGKSLTPEAYQQMRTYVRRQVMPMQIETIANQTMTSGGTPVTSLSTDQQAAQWQAESGGSQFGPDGKPLVSAKGAVGIAQLIPSTAEATAKANSIAWDPNKFENDAAYNANLGTLTMNSLLEQSGGNYAVALAKYNAGPDGPGVAHFAQTGDPTQLPLETQQYVNEVTGGGDMEDQIARAQAAAEKAFPDDPEEASQMAESTVYRLTYQRQAVLRNQMAAQKQASDAFSTNITNEIYAAQDSGKPLSPNLVQQIDGANIDIQTKTDLRKLALNATGQTETSGYGSGYTSALNSIVAPYGTQGKISDLSQLIHLQAQGAITPSGFRELSGTLRDMSSSQNAGVAQYKAGLLAYARTKLTFDGDNDFPGMPPMKDPAGLAAYDTKFIPMYEASFNAWVKQGKDPMAYPVDQLDKMITQLRPQSQFDAARIAAEGGDPTDPSGATPPGQPSPAAAPPPPAPPTVKSPAAWSDVMANPPVLQNGQFPTSNWTAAITHLMADPNKQTIAQFDQTFGPYGYNGEELVQQLSTAPSQPNPAVPQPVMP